MALSQDIDMIVNPLDNIFNIGDNFDKMRGRSLTLSIYRSRSLLISSSDCDEGYHI